MDKADYIAEMLSEELEHYQIAPDLIMQCAKGIVDGLDMWYELSGDSVATSNRYSSLESEITKAKQQGEKNLAEEQKRNKTEMEERERNSRWAIQRKNEEIERLQKLIKS